MLPQQSRTQHRSRAEGAQHQLPHRRDHGGYSDRHHRLVFSVILAVGALIVAMGAGEGNALYEPISTVCNVLAGPLKDAFDFTGPSAASREEFLGWGAGSLIYLALSFAGQAGHRALTRS